MPALAPASILDIAKKKAATMLRVGCMVASCFLKKVNEPKDRRTYHLNPAGNDCNRPAAPKNEMLPSPRSVCEIRQKKKAVKSFTGLLM
jgi:hypothetical protein